MKYFSKSNVLLVVSNTVKEGEKTLAKANKKFISYHKIDGAVQALKHLEKQIRDMPILEIKGMEPEPRSWWYKIFLGR